LQHPFQVYQASNDPALILLSLSTNLSSLQKALSRATMQRTAQGVAAGITGAQRFLKRN